MKVIRGGLIAGLAALLLAAAAGAWWYAGYRAFLDEPLVKEGERLVFVLSPGTSYRGMVRELEQLGIAENPLHWRVLGWRHDAGRRIRAGEYAVAPGMTPEALLDDVMSGRVVQHAFTIVEGWTFRELMAAIARHEVLAQTLEDLPDEEVMARLDRPDQHPEGRFLPETYRFPRSTTDLALLRRAHAAMERELEAAWNEREEGLPYVEPDDVLVMASIIEKETAVAEERGRIAGVFVRRLERGMRLQTDPSVIYGLGKRYDGRIRRADLVTDTPYNTYTRHGLPPTPIALPGRASLHAAVRPAPGTELYFVSRGDGTHVFSDTLKEHNRAVARYQLGITEDSR